jgi:hypothetical protein
MMDDAGCAGNDGRGCGTDPTPSSIIAAAGGEIIHHPASVMAPQPP